MTYEREIERVPPRERQACTAHVHTELTEDELAQIVGGTDGPGNPTDP